MKIILTSKRHISGSIFLAIAVVIIVIIFGGLFISLAARCRKLPTRTFDEDTNSASASFIWNDTAPLVAQQVDQNSDSTNIFEYSVSFLWNECMTNGIVLILRTFDWKEWVMLYTVSFGKQTWSNAVMAGPSGPVTNLVTIIPFRDESPLPSHAFYKGVIVTNAPVRALTPPP